MRIFKKKQLYETILKKNKVDYSEIMMEFTESILKKLYQDDKKFVTSFVSATLDYKGNHSILLIFSKNDRENQLEL